MFRIGAAAAPLSAALVSSLIIPVSGSPLGGPGPSPPVTGPLASHTPLDDPHHERPKQPDPEDDQEGDEEQAMHDRMEAARPGRVKPPSGR